MNSFNILILFSTILLSCNFCYSQETDTLPRKELRKKRKTTRIEEGKLLISPLAGPAYTPELKFTLAAGILISYKTNRNDSLIQRSSSPLMFGISTTGAYFFSSRTSSFWLKDKLRIYMDIWFKDMPDHYWGVGYENGYNKPKSDSTTAYQRLWWQLNPILLWQFRQDYFIGLNIDYNYTRAEDPSAGIMEDPDFIKYGSSNLNSGLGINLRYDSRDIPVNAWVGTYLDLKATFYQKMFGGNNNYQIVQIDFRKYYPVASSIKGKTLAIQLKTRISIGNVPYPEMSKLGSPYDLRGYTWGQFRDKNMIFLLGEYRHMFSNATGDPGRHGFVLWIGTGSVAKDISELINWLPNIGLGYRFEVQPRMNLRIEYGFGMKSSGFYFNFNEAF